MSNTVAVQSVERTVIDALVDFGVDRDAIVLHAKLGELDLDSLDLAELSQVIEEAHGIGLTGQEVKGIETVGDAIDLVVSRLA